MKRLDILLLADTHFGHNRLIELGYRPHDFEDRLQKSIAEIGPNIPIIHLGDVAFYDEEKWHYRIMELRPYNKKWLTLGNHDKKTLSWYLKQGWDFVGHSISLNIFGYKILFSHEPLPLNGHDFNVHGHLHDSDHRLPEVQDILTDKHLLVKMEHDYKPVSLRKLLGK